MAGELKLIAGNSNPKLAAEISHCLGISLCDVSVQKFPDGESSVHIRETVRGEDVFIIQSTSPPVNDHTMELLLMIDALKRASARQITAVIPYYGYARQDRKHIGRVPISARLIANFIEVAGADRMLTLDLPAGQIQGFFNIPVDNLRIDPIVAKHLTNSGLAENSVIVAPDVGAAKRASSVAERLHLPYAIVEKSRVSEKTGEVQARTIIGNVKGKIAIIVDDIIATGGTVVAAAQLLKDEGAKEVHATFSHGVFAADAVAKLEKSQIKSIGVTNSIPPPESEKIQEISVGKVFADIIQRVYEGQSVSQLFPHY